MMNVAITFGVMAVMFFCNAGQEGNMGDPDTSYIRPAAVAGSFYPGSPTELAKMLAEFFHAAPKPKIAGRPIALVAPHAGYVYSGGIAARAYKALVGEEYKSVIVISPSHTSAFKGVAAFDGKAYSTPFGEAPVDREMTAQIVAASDLIALSDKGHFRGPGRSEHALEVQLPFLQTTLRNFSLVALVMGDQDPYTSAELGQALAKVIGNRTDVLIVASSDLSHFHDSQTAGHLDSVIVNDIKKFDFHGLSNHLEAQKTEACGGGPIVAAMMAAKELGANKTEITGYGDSGDTGGDKSSVVGYLSALIYKEPESKVYELDSIEDETPRAEVKPANVMGRDLHLNPATAVEFGLSADDKKTLLKIAHQAIETQLRRGKMVFPENISPSLQLPLGAFVTLTEAGELRGCIGILRASNPLYQVVAEMACQAAFSDYRFSPILSADLPNLDVEISVLTPMKRIYNPDSVDVGKDGLYIKRGSCSGLLLPQVPVEQAWDRKQFLEHTCLKAGLPTDSWKDKQTELYVFQAEIFGER